VISIRESNIICKKKPTLKNPICVVGLPGIGHIGRISVDYMIHELKAEKFAELYSPNFFPFVVVHDDKIHTLRNEFFYYKSKKKGGRDLIFLIGDCQSFVPTGHYEVCGKILDFLKSLNCKEVVTIGGFATGKIVENPGVYGVVMEDKQAKALTKYGVSLDVGGKITTIIGASGLLIGLAKPLGMSGFCLLGETSGYPIVTDPHASEAVLKVLMKVLGVKFELKNLKDKVDHMYGFIKKLQNVQTQAMEKMQPKGDEDLKYIG
jgi:uncharacterized protein